MKKKKIINMGGIFSLILFLLKFNGKVNDRGVDDEIPILSYASIKAQTLRIFSNVKFMELYIGEQKSKKEGNQLTKILGVCEHMKDLSYENLFPSARLKEEDINNKKNKQHKRIVLFMHIFIPLTKVINFWQNWNGK